MIKINKNLVTFLGLTFLLGALSLFALQKLFPLVSHTIYYCQSFLNSLSMSIPYYLGAVPFLLFFALLLIAATKLLIVFVKVLFPRKKLLKKSKSNTSFNTLLEKLQLADETRVIESKKHFAFCLGIRHPKIYISTSLVNLLTLQEAEAVLRHERYHLNNRDALTMLVASIGQSLLPFFPLFSDLLRNFRIEREIKADTEAIRGLGSKKPLISVLKKLLVVPSVATVAASAIADHDTLEPRICALIKRDFRFKRFRARRIFISFFSVLVMGAIAFAPVQAVEVHHQGEDVMMVCPNNDECLNACRQKYSINEKNYSENISYSYYNE